MFLEFGVNLRSLVYDNDVGEDVMVDMGSDFPGTNRTRQTIDSSCDKAAVMRPSNAAVSSLVRLYGYEDVGPVGYVDCFECDVFW